MADQELKELRVFECPDCGGSGRVSNHSPYEPVGFSAHHAAKMRASVKTCTACRGRGFLLKSAKPDRSQFGACKNPNCRAYTKQVNQSMCMECKKIYNSAVEDGRLRLDSHRERCRQCHDQYTIQKMCSEGQRLYELFYDASHMEEV